MSENVFVKLQNARVLLQKRGVKPTGKNTYADYTYVDLPDFLPQAQLICMEVGICGVVTFTSEVAELTIVNLENPEERIIFSSPMSSVTLKGCHPVQNLGALQSYLRRYLWVAALEVVECDAIDSSAPLATGDSTITYITKAQVGQFQKEFVARGVNKEKFLAVAGVKTLEEIPASSFTHLMKQVQMKPVLNPKKADPPKKEEAPKTEGPVMCDCPSAPGMKVPYVDCSKSQCHVGCTAWDTITRGLGDASK